MEGSNLLQQVLGCTADDALHYINIFDGDTERAATVVLENRENEGWWGHPWNTKENSEELVYGEEMGMVR